MAAAIGFGPTLALRHRRTFVGFDFAGGLPAWASLTRASAGTRTNAAGVVASEAANVARLDHDPVTLAPRGLLVEPQRTNTFIASEDWTGSGWSRAGVAASATALIEDGSTGSHRVRSAGSNNYLHVAGEAFTMSAIAGERAGSAKRYLVLGPGSASLFTSGTPAAVFDLAAGSVVTTGPGTAGIEAAPGGWLCWLAATPTGSGSGFLDFRLSNASGAANPSYAGDASSGVNLTQAQVEAGSAATSRIQTAGAAATRAADALTLDWRSRGAADGTATVRYAFDDGTSQDVATTIVDGLAAVPTTLARPRLKRATIV